MASSIKESDYDSFVAPHQDLEIDKLFRACVKLEASDLHLKVGRPPMVRVNGSGLAENSVVAEALASAGFVATPKGVRLPRTTG